MGKPKDKKSFSHHRSDKKGRLEEGVLQYYRRVSLELDQEFEDDEQKHTFFRNVFNQLCTEALKVSQNQTVSNIVEALLRKAAGDHLLDFFKAMRVDWEVACTDRFASHVTQTLLLCTHRVLGDTEVEGDLKQELKEKLCEPFHLLRSNLGLHIQGTYASYILRTYIEIFSCVRVSDSIVKSRIKTDYKPENSDSEDFIKDVNFDGDDFKHVEKMVCDIIAFPTLRAYLLNEISNPVIQTLMIALSKRDKELCDRLCAVVMEHCFDKEQTEGIATDVIGSRIVEQLFAVCSDDLFDSLFRSHIKAALPEWCTHPVANFIVQKLLLNFRSKEQFEKAFKRMVPHLEDVLSKNCFGIVVNLAKATLQHSTKQQKFLESIMRAFQCFEPQERQSKLVQLLACMTTYDVFYKIPDIDDDASDTDDKESNELIALPTLGSISLHGSVLIQTLLGFGNPRLVISSLLDLSRTELKLMACDPRGSYIFDTFLKSSTVGEKSKEHLLMKLRGTYVELACNKCGSRVMDRIWEKASIKQKTAIAEELVSKEAKVQGDRFGSFLWQTCGLRNFKSRRKEWEQFQAGTQIKRKMFEDMLSPKQSSMKSKRLKEDQEDMGGRKLILDNDDAVERMYEKTSNKKGTGKKSQENKSKNEEQVKDLKNTRDRRAGEKKKTEPNPGRTKRNQVPNSKPQMGSKRKKRPSLKQRIKLKQQSVGKGRSSKQVT